MNINIALYLNGTVRFLSQPRNAIAAAFATIVFAVWPFSITSLARNAAEPNILLAMAGGILGLVAGIAWAAQNEDEPSFPFGFLTVVAVVGSLVLASMAADVAGVREYETVIGAVLLGGFSFVARRL